MTSIFNDDSEYQAVVNEYKKGRAELESKAEKGYKFDILYAEGTDIYSEFSMGIQDIMNNRMERTKSEIEELSDSKQTIGYAKRADEAKELEIRYALADDHDLKGDAENLKTDDLLEISLLRMELRKRGLNDYDQLAKNYVARNKLDGMTEKEEAKQNSLHSIYGTLRTLGTETAVIDNKATPLKNVQQELYDIAKVGNNNAR